MDYKLRFGANAPSLSDQLNEQIPGVTFTPKELELEQKLSNAITLLGVSSILSESEVTRSRKRLMKRINKVVSTMAETTMSTTDEEVSSDES